jgi:hypothetical protein
VKLRWHHFFVPHERNNHRAILLQPSFIGIFIAIYLLNQSLIKYLSFTNPGVLGYSSEITTQKVIQQTNEQRQKLNLSPLKYNSVLSVSATKKGEDMFKNNYWAHNSPTGTTPWSFFKAEGYEYSIAGENLAKDFYDTDSMMSAWMNSPTHRDNIVNSKYQEVGIGVVNGVLNGVKTTIVIQHFGTPINPVAIVKDTPKAKEIIVDQNNSNKQVLADSNITPLVSPLEISKVVGSAMFLLIIVTLIIDGIVTLRRGTNRLTGSSAGHVGFLAIILMLLIFSRQGSVF